MATRFSDIGIVTPSEMKVIKELLANTKLNILCVTRNRAGNLFVDVDVKARRKKKKHEPPFKYRSIAYDKWGRQLYYQAGNQYEDYTLIDNFTTIRRQQ